MLPGGFEETVDNHSDVSASLAAAITRAASKQTYYTIWLLADRGRVADAYRAYGYFRWVDDVIDKRAGCKTENAAFIERQYSILEACYRGSIPRGLCGEEWMLADLVRNDGEQGGGLHAYLYNMMEVMRFDTERCGEIISHKELSEYSQKLATAVTEALHYFIGHDNPTPPHESRYLAVTAAHITHMLRDALEDTATGYFNISREYLEARGILPNTLDGQAYRAWVRSRVQLARSYFKAGRECIAHVRNLRCRLAGYAYAARFEWILRTIEREGYRLRASYPERKGLPAGAWILWRIVLAMLTPPKSQTGLRSLAVQSLRMKDR